MLYTYGLSYVCSKGNGFTAIVHCKNLEDAINKAMLEGLPSDWTITNIYREPETP